jgi:hypothetical protein
MVVLRLRFSKPDGLTTPEKFHNYFPESVARVAPSLSQSETLDRPKRYAGDVRAVAPGERSLADGSILQIKSNHETYDARLSGLIGR